MKMSNVKHTPEANSLQSTGKQKVLLPLKQRRVDRTPIAINIRRLQRGGVLTVRYDLMPNPITK